jgi:glyoxylase-like metal-dependent hydrolase (beta-lactamase superfamily II)
MQLTFVGHASWLVRSGKTSLLTDPTLGTAFTSGVWEVSPTRRVALARLPKLDAIFISHAHRDHFDLATLARLRRTCRVFCPADPEILYALERLGFKDVVQVSAWSFHTLGTLELLFTPSEVRFPELGLLVSDGEVACWNQVDTEVGLETLERVREKLGPLDLVAHGYQPMLELAALEAQRTDFPYEAYRAILHRARLLAPRALVPASSGERVTGSGAWLNAYKFPVSRERFVRDLASLLPDTRTFVPNPGDVLDVRARGTRLRRQRAPASFVRTVVDDAAASTAFDPGGEKPALRDENPRALSSAQLARIVHWFFEKHARQVCAGLPETRAEFVLGALLSFRVVYPDRSLERWTVDFGARPPRIGLAPHDDADYVLRIAASSLHALITGEIRLDAVVQSGGYRTFSQVYRVGVDGMRNARELCPPALHGDPPFSIVRFLGELLVPNEAAARQRLDAELAHATRRALARGLGQPFWLARPPREWGAAARARSRRRQRR